MIFRLFALTLATTLSFSAFSSDGDIVIDTAERYLRLQTQGLQGKVTISMGKLDTNRLPACTAHEAYAPPGTRFYGKTYIGVRCLGPNIWSVLVPAQIAVTGNYVSTTRALSAGQMIQPGDLAVLSGDISSLPTGIVTNIDIATGKTLKNSLGAGQVIRNDQLLSPLVIRQGQSVRVISKGAGFLVSAEGKAVNNATEGQMTQVRMSSGQTISGIAKSNGSVEVSN